LGRTLIENKIIQTRYGEEETTRQV
jgi:hypothetical protein